MTLETWWISTPDWTIAVTHDANRIVAIALILWRAWHGKSWRALVRWGQRRYGAQ